MRADRPPRAIWQHNDRLTGTNKTWLTIVAVLVTVLVIVPTILMCGGTLVFLALLGSTGGPE